MKRFIVALVILAIVTTSTLPTATAMAQKQSFVEVSRVGGECRDIEPSSHFNFLYAACGSKVMIFHPAFPNPMLVGILDENQPINNMTLSEDGMWLYVSVDYSHLNIYDLSITNKPAIVSRLDITVDDMELQDNVLYVTTMDDARTYDVSSPAAPKLLGTWMAPTNYPLLDLAVLRGQLFVFQLLGDIVELDVSNPTAIKFVKALRNPQSPYRHQLTIDDGSGKLIITGSPVTRAEIVNVVTGETVAWVNNGHQGDLAGDFAYVAGEDGVEITNFKTGEVVTVTDNFLHENIDVKIDAGVVYVSSAATGIHVFHGWDKPEVIANYLLPGSVFTVSGELAGGSYGVYRFSPERRLEDFVSLPDVTHINPVNNVIYVCVMAGMFVERPGLFVLDINSLEIVAEFPITNGCAMSIVRENVAFVTSPSGLHIVDVSNPAQPVEISSYAANSARLALEGNLVYITDWNSGVQVIDVSDLEHPKQVGAVWLGEKVVNAALLHDGFLWVLHQQGALSKVDVDDLSQIQIVDTITLPGPLYNLTPWGQYILIGGSSQMLAVDISSGLSLVARTDGPTRTDIDIVDGLILASEGGNGLAWYRLTESSSKKLYLPALFHEASPTIPSTPPPPTPRVRPTIVVSGTPPPVRTPPDLP